MCYRFLKTLSLTNEHVAPFEFSTFNEAVLVSIYVAIGFAGDIAEKFAEMKGRVDIKQVSQKEDTFTGIVEVKHIKEQAATEKPLHNYGVKQESIKDAHA